MDSDLVCLAIKHPCFGYFLTGVICRYLNPRQRLLLQDLPGILFVSRGLGSHLTFRVGRFYTFNAIVVDLYRCSTSLLYFISFSLQRPVLVPACTPLCGSLWITCGWQDFTVAKARFSLRLDDGKVRGKSHDMLTDGIQQTCIILNVSQGPNIFCIPLDQGKKSGLGNTPVCVRL